MLLTLLGNPGLASWIWSTVICVGAFRLFVSYWKVRRNRGRVLAIQLRLEAAMQNVKAASAVAAARGTKYAPANPRAEETIYKTKFPAIYRGLIQ